MIIGCDFHTRYQQIAMMDEATGELTERRLDHESGEADAFYRNVQGPVRVGIEATGPIRWFERLLAELGHELWIGDAAKIRASEVRKQKTDERDALLILDLLLAKRFPRIWRVGQPLNFRVADPSRFSAKSRGFDFISDCDIPPQLIGQVLGFVPILS